jgi:arylamine N-acetyltransferase
MDPLRRPHSRELLDQFRAHYGLANEGAPRRQLADLARAFSAIPYENLTKILKDAESVSAERACRSPDEVIADHQRWRTGGTCFSLTATLLYLVRSLGLPAEPILADRRYGADTHCALLVWLDGQPHLIDPGYLIVDPVPLTTPNEKLVVRTAFNEIQLVATTPERLELYTAQQNDRRYRLTFKTNPVDAIEFRRAWRASFDWDMMHYPLLTKVSGDVQLYMRGNHLQRRSASDVRREQVPQDLLVQRMSSAFGISREVILKAMRVLQHQGTRYGPHSAR